MSHERAGLGATHVRVTGNWTGPDHDRPVDGFHRGLPAPSGQVDIQFLMSVASVFDEAEEILIGRHRDYGPGNIANGYPDPLTALVVRMSDKLERIKNLLSTSDAAYGERLRDSWLDLGNYALIGVMVQDKSWPGIRASHVD